MANTAERNYAEIGLRYARDVQNDKLTVGKWTKKAIQRTIQDHKQCDGFRFDQAKANKVCAFIEHLPHVKGILGGKLIQLQPWQIWILTEVFGWIHDGGNRDGLRRFRTVYLELGRGNGKSCISSALALYMLAADGEYGAEVYCCATTAAQARIVHDDAKAMAKSASCAKLMNALGVEVFAHSITVSSKNSKFVATSSEYGRMDGYNVSAAIIDELHAHPDRGLWDVIITGAGKRPQSLIWSITTAGSDRTGICYEQRTYLTKILDRVAEDNTFFGCIWCADDDDDWQDEASIIKANPNYQISVEGSYLASLITKAKTMPAAINSFKTKHLCCWISANNAWMDIQLWDKCKDETLVIEDFESDPCFVGLDLASKIDVAAKIKLFTRTINGETHYYSFGTYWLPESAVKDGRNSAYPGWELTGQLTVTPGNVISFDDIETDLLADSTHFCVQDIAYDPWQSEQLAQRMIANGAKMIEYRPTVMNFSAPMKELDALVRSGRFHHNDPILSWMASNVVCHRDQKDNIFPRKERVEDKIDGIIALLMALGRAMLMQEETGDLVVFV